MEFVTSKGPRGHGNNEIVMSWTDKTFRADTKVPDQLYDWSSDSQNARSFTHGIFSDCQKIYASPVASLEFKGSEKVQNFRPENGSVEAVKPAS